MAIPVNTPPVGHVTKFFSPADGRPYWRDAAGVDHPYSVDRVVTGGISSGVPRGYNVLDFGDDLCGAGKQSYAGAMTLTGLSSVEVNGLGSGYEEDDIVDVAGGTAGQAIVLGVNGSGGVTNITVSAIGTGYPASQTGAATTGGSGSGLTLDTTSTTDLNAVNIHTSNGGDEFAPGDVGKSILFSGVQGSGIGISVIDIWSTIVSYVDPNTVIIADMPPGDGIAANHSGDVFWFNAAQDDTTAIQAAIDATDDAYSRVYLPAGVYVRAGALTNARNLREIFGDGPERTVVLTKSADISTKALDFTDVSNFKLADISFRGPGQNASFGGLLSFELVVQSNTGNIVFDNVAITHNAESGAYMNTPILTSFRNCFFGFNAFHGVHLFTAVSTTFSDCYGITNLLSAFHLDNGAAVHFHGCAAEASGMGYYILNSTSITFSACDAEHQSHRAPTAPTNFPTPTVIGAPITAVELNGTGTGYVAHELVGIYGNSSGFIEILSVDGGGKPLTASVFTPGEGFWTASGFATTGGSGTGLTVGLVAAAVPVGSYYLMYAWARQVNDLALEVDSLPSPESSQISFGGPMEVIVPNNPGTLYLVNDVITPTSPDGSGATFKVVSVDGGGGVTGLFPVTYGRGYRTSAGVATTGGAGTGLTVDYTIANPNEVLTLTIPVSPDDVPFMNYVRFYATDPDGESGSEVIAPEFPINPSPDTTDLTIKSFFAGGSTTRPLVTSYLGHAYVIEGSDNVVFDGCTINTVPTADCRYVLIAGGSENITLSNVRWLQQTSPAPAFAIEMQDGNMLAVRGGTTRLGDMSIGASVVGTDLWLIDGHVRGGTTLTRFPSPPAGTQLLDGVDVGTSNVGWKNWSLIVAIPANAWHYYNASWKLRLAFTAGTGAHFQNLVIHRTLKGSLDVIGTTQVLIGGVMPATVAFTPPHQILTDEITIQLDSLHDYYVAAYFDDDSGGDDYNDSLGLSEQNPAPDDTQLYADTFNASDQTGIAVIPALADRVLMMLGAEQA